MVSSYTNISDLNGLAEPVDYGSGVQHADGLAELAPGADLLLGLWLGGSPGLSSLSSGALDPQVARLVSYLSSCPFPTVRVRVGYEFDNPAFGYSPPPLYVEAYGVLAKALAPLRAEGRVRLVWHSMAHPGSTTPASLLAYYPGDALVDEVGVSLFEAPYSAELMASGPAVVAAFAAARGKPLLVAEASPYGAAGVLSPNVTSSWFSPVLSFLSSSRASAFCYISADWQAQPMWAGSQFGDSRLTSNPRAFAWWNKHVILGPRFDPKREDGGGGGEALRAVAASALVAAGAVFYWWWGSRPKRGGGGGTRSGGAYGSLE